HLGLPRRADRPTFNRRSPARHLGPRAASPAPPSLRFVREARGRTHVKIGNRWRRPLAGLLLLSVVAAACGGDDGDDAASTAGAGGTGDLSGEIDISGSS